MRHSWGIAFDGDTKHLVYNTSDIGCPTKGASEVAPRRIHAPGWKDARLVPGDSGGHAWLGTSYTRYIPFP